MVAFQVTLWMPGITDGWRRLEGARCDEGVDGGESPGQRRVPSARAVETSPFHRGSTEVPARPQLGRCRRDHGRLDMDDLSLFRAPALKQGGRWGRGAG